MKSRGLRCLSARPPIAGSMAAGVAIQCFLLGVSTMSFFASRSIAWVPVRLVLALVFLFSVAACSTFARTELYTFFYDIYPSSGAKLLDWRFGKADEHYMQADRQAVADERVNPSGGVGGYLRVWDTLYVRWRDLKTGIVHEDTADYGAGLPDRLEDHTLYFDIDRNQLRVFLITPLIRKEGEPIVGRPKYKYNVVIQLYPK
jgi:hypothetical protein